MEDHVFENKYLFYHLKIKMIQWVQKDCIILFRLHWIIYTKYCDMGTKRLQHAFHTKHDNLYQWTSINLKLLQKLPIDHLSTSGYCKNCQALADKHNQT